jgi:hypothetical protein
LEASERWLEPPVSLHKRLRVHERVVLRQRIAPREDGVEEHRATEGRYLRFYGVSWAIRRRLSRWKQAGLPTATANLCLGGVKCAQPVAFSRTREVEVHDAPLHRRAARPDRHEVARRRHATTTYRSTPHALRARGWPVCESISPQSCHACPSPSHRSVSELRTTGHRSRQPRKLSPSGLRTRSGLFAHFIDHRPLPGGPPVLWASTPG